MSGDLSRGQELADDRLSAHGAPPIDVENASGRPSGFVLSPIARVDIPGAAHAHAGMEGEAAGLEPDEEVGRAHLDRGHRLVRQIVETARARLRPEHLDVEDDLANQRAAERRRLLRQPRLCGGRRQGREQRGVGARTGCRGGRPPVPPNRRCRRPRAFNGRWRLDRSRHPLQDGEGTRVDRGPMPRVGGARQTPHRRPRRQSQHEPTHQPGGGGHARTPRASHSVPARRRPPSHRRRALHPDALRPGAVQAVGSRRREALRSGLERPAERRRARSPAPEGRARASPRRRFRRGRW